MRHLFLEACLQAYAKSEKNVYEKSLVFIAETYVCDDPMTFFYSLL